MPPSSSSSFSLLGIFKYIDSCLSLFLTHTHKQKEREKEYFWWSVSDRPSKPATTSKKLTNASLFSFYCLLISLVCLTFVHMPGDLVKRCTHLSGFWFLHLLSLMPISLRYKEKGNYSATRSTLDWVGESWSDFSIGSWFEFFQFKKKLFLFILKFII